MEAKIVAKHFGANSFSISSLPQKVLDYLKWDDAYVSSLSSRRRVTSPLNRNSANLSTFLKEAAIAAMMGNTDFCKAVYPDCGGIIFSEGIYFAQYNHTNGDVCSVMYNPALTANNVRGIGLTADWKLIAGLDINGNNKFYSAIPLVCCMLQSMLDWDEKNSSLFYGNQLSTFSTAEIANAKKELVLTLEIIRNGLDNSSFDTKSEDFLNALFIVSDIIYYGMAGDLFRTGIRKDGTIPRLENPTPENGKARYSGRTFFGNPTLFNDEKQKGSVSKKAKKVDVKSIINTPEVQKYRDKWANKWTDEEISLIPSNKEIPDSMAVPPEVIDFVNVITATMDDKRPFVQMMWRGTSAYGKSTGVKMLCRILNLPYLVFGCDPDTEKVDFLTQLMPETKKPQSKVSFSEIELDPETAYKKLTGTYVPGITCEQAFEKAMELGSGTMPRYHLVESTYIQALSKGYCVEVQEVSRIRKSGVVAGLNEYDHAGARIPLADGTFVQRHPRALSIFTDNVGYESCNQLDPSFVRRCAFIKNSDKMTKERVLARIKSNLGSNGIMKNAAFINKLYEVWMKVQDECKQNGWLDAGGSCTVEELERTIQLIGIYGYDGLQKALDEGLVNKATDDFDAVETIRKAIIAPATSELLSLAV